MSRDPRFPEFVAPLTPANLAPKRCAAGPPQRASHRILIQRNGAHGDILMGTPLLTALRTALPDAHITWLVERKEREAIDANPYVDELLLWDTSYWKHMVRRGLIVPWAARALRMRQELRERRFDIFISFQPEEWPLLARNAGAAVRIGVFDTFRQFAAETRTSGNTRYYTHAFRYGQLPPHRTDQYLLPLDTLQIAPPAEKRMTLGFTAEDDAVVSGFLQESGLGGAPFVVLAPMTTWPTRCWDGDRYAALADRLASDGFRAVLIGSAKEREPVEAVAAATKQSRPVIAAGNLSFRQMGALVARASVLVSGDTGPMHVAAAVGTPYVALFGPTPVEGRIPFSARGLTLVHSVPCGPCDRKACRNTGDDHMRCMRLITVDETYAAVRRLLPALLDVRSAPTGVGQEPA